MPYARAKSSETLAEVVARTCPGFSVASIRSHPKNAALFKSRSEFVLKEGDPIWFPDEEPEPEWFSVRIGGTLDLVVANTRSLKIVLRRPNREPFKNQRYTLTLDGKEYTGTTSETGLLEATVPYSATRGVVRVQGYRQAIKLGEIQPINTAKGVQARLRNLGFGVGKVDGNLSAKSAEGIRRFQASQGLAATGMINDATRAALEKQHGC